jgi:heme-degrading monooxygenase HmoA
MHATVVKVTINDSDAAEEYLKNEVVPRVSGAPGFKAGWWTRSLDRSNGMGVVVWESEEAANRAVEALKAQASSGHVELQDIEVREVVANA